MDELDHCSMDMPNGLTWVHVLDTRSLEHRALGNVLLREHWLRRNKQWCVRILYHIVHCA